MAETVKWTIADNSNTTALPLSSCFKAIGRSHTMAVKDKDVQVNKLFYLLRLDRSLTYFWATDLSSMCIFDRFHGTLFIFKLNKAITFEK